MEAYNPPEIEPKWAKRWVEEGIFRAKDDAVERRVLPLSVPPASAPGQSQVRAVGIPSERVTRRSSFSVPGKKSYILIEFPYPSGERLHVGHARSYSCLDAVARKRRMQGENVMFPFGWDAFGLPAENYAIKTGIHPAITTKQNIENSRKQAIRWGLSFDWSREVDTTDPNYYKWTQWIFVQLFKHGLAYKDNIAVNWCPSCKTNLANEEVIDGKCERCGTQAERRMQSQWLLRITKYADRLLSDLETVNYREDIKRQQVEWIGRSEGVRIEFKIQNAKLKIPVFTTAIDTVFGVTFMVLSPEVAKSLLNIVPEPRKGEIDRYIRESLAKSELERQAEGKVKTGVDMGIRAVNPFTQDKIPIFVADYVLKDYGTGAVMGVPGHDARDYEFAKKYNLPIRPVIKPVKEVVNLMSVAEDGFWDYPEIVKFADRAVLFNSGKFDGQAAKEAKMRLEKELVEKGIGEKAVNYHLRDWVFSRQHYWGEPIPMIFCSKCKSKGKSWFTTKEGSALVADENFESSSVSLANERKLTSGSPSRAQSEVAQNFVVSSQSVASLAGWYPVAEGVLPVELPKVEKFQPSQTGESPLANVREWVNATCPECGGPARRETDTMPNWAGSNWYYVAYTFWHKLQRQTPNTKHQIPNARSVFDIYRDNLRYWLPVDWYNGGMEHITLHLLYSRFIYKFLFDIGAVPTLEPYAKRTSHGVVLGPDGRKMSKSQGNVVNPDEIVAKYGADTLRVYEMFIGPFDQMVVWDDRAAAGVHRFLKRVWEMATEFFQDKKIRGSSDESQRRIARLVAKIDSDLEGMKFNTAVAALMEFVNWWSDHENEVGEGVLESFLKALAPLAPFITEELYQRLWVSKFEIRNSKFNSIHLQPWPIYEKSLIKAQKLTIVVQVNGKTRGTVVLDAPEGGKPIARKDVEIAAKSDPGINKHLAGKSASRVIWVQDKLINFVVG